MSHDVQILHDVSFTIGAGEKRRHSGTDGFRQEHDDPTTGSLLRLPTMAMIFLDGYRPVQPHPHTRACAGASGVVLQDFHIFSGSVAENISLGDPGISRDRVEEAGRLVHADPFIRALPQGYDTPLSERGQNLSHGQRQLLAFARVLAADPEILVLDEATASIDTRTELLIQDALHRVTEGRTSI